MIQEWATDFFIF